MHDCCPVEAIDDIWLCECAPGGVRGDWIGCLGDVLGVDLGDVLGMDLGVENNSF